MTKKNKPHFCPEFWQETAHLAVDQINSGHTTSMGYIHNGMVDSEKQTNHFFVGIVRS